MRVLEFFSGIGGCAAALGTVADAVLAFDIDQSAVATYRHNYPNHQCEARAIESLASTRLGQFAADLWWMSPPCQPFTKQGKQRDGNDARSSPFLRLIDQVCKWLPRYVALENVSGFATSKTRQRLLNMLKQCGYTICEFDACPTQLGWPMRRQRYYLVASRGSTLRSTAIQSAKRGWSDFWNPHSAAGRQFVFPEDVLLQKYCSHLHLMRWDASDAIARCFTSAYGRSPLRSGSYVEEHDGRIRHFAPEELLRLMGFPKGYRFPEGVSTRTAWSLIGNSLAVPVVRYVLSTIPELAPILPAGDGDGRHEEGGIY